MIAEQGDITTYRVDAIVNAANPFLKNGGGVCGAIFRAAGVEEIEEECQQIIVERNHKPLKQGECTVTRGYKLAAKYVIHAVGPVWQGGEAGEQKALEQCYRNIMRVCREKGIQDVAIPAISTGIFAFPIGQATEIAVRTVAEFLASYRAELTVRFVCFNGIMLNLYEYVLRTIIST